MERYGHNTTSDTLTHMLLLPGYPQETQIHSLIYPLLPPVETFTYLENSTLLLPMQLSAYVHNYVFPLPTRITVIDCPYRIKRAIASWSAALRLANRNYSCIPCTFSRSRMYS